MVEAAVCFFIIIIIIIIMGGQGVRRTHGVRPLVAEMGEFASKGRASVAMPAAAM